jgi:hypothetical protein
VTQSAATPRRSHTIVLIAEIDGMRGSNSSFKRLRGMRNGSTGHFRRTPEPKLERPDIGIASDALAMSFRPESGPRFDPERKDSATR